jgi:uncharacterized protein with GYD domain
LGDRGTERSNTHAQISDPGTLGSDDVVLIVEAPDNIAVAAVSLSAGATGLVNIRTTPLVTVDEVDQALALPIKFRGAGQ